jgi:dTDP-4-dehydrorhamnose 3,5-epimerase-like enzyme
MGQRIDEANPEDGTPQGSKELKTIADWLPLKRDERGSVCELLETERLPDQQNVHVVLTGPGGIRGNHFHRKGEETVVVYGPALVRIREGETTSDTVVPEGKVLRLVIPPGVSHAIKNTGSQPNVLVAFNTMRHDPQNADTVKDILLQE